MGGNIIGKNAICVIHGWYVGVLVDCRCLNTIQDLLDATVEFQDDTDDISVAYVVEQCAIRWPVNEVRVAN